MNKKYKRVFRGEVYLARLPKGEGSEQTGERPVVIIQNDIGNKHSPTVIVAAVTSQLNKAKLPTHLEYTLLCDSIIICEQIFTISKDRLMTKIGQLDEDTVNELNKKLMISIGLMEVS